MRSVCGNWMDWSGRDWDGLGIWVRDWIWIGWAGCGVSVYFRWIFEWRFTFDRRVELIHANLTSDVLAMIHFPFFPSSVGQSLSILPQNPLSIHN